VVLEEAQRDLAAWLTRWQRNYPNLTNGGWEARRMNADEGGKSVSTCVHPWPQASQ
jgi:hypothetical protein